MTVRVLVVDDSPLVADVISGILIGDPEFELVGVARNGREAVALTARLRPDVITMDIEMPVMDGLAAIEQIMAATPTPILVVTADPRLEGGELNFEALRRGALDVMAKPAALEAHPQHEALREQLKLLAGVAVVRRPMARSRLALGSARDQWSEPTGPGRGPFGAGSDLHPALAGLEGEGSTVSEVVAICASTGGPAALAQIFEGLPAGFPAAIAVVQHIAAGFSQSLTTWLDDVSPLDVKLAEHDHPLRAGQILIAPDSQHLSLTKQGRVALDDGPPIEGHRPAGTRLLASAATAFGKRAVGLVLTGMGRDGVDGLGLIRQAGGTTLAQDEASCVVYGMPRAAVEADAAQRTVELAHVADLLCRLVRRR